MVNVLYCWWDIVAVYWPVQYPYTFNQCDSCCHYNFGEYTVQLSIEQQNICAKDESCRWLDFECREFTDCNWCCRRVDDNPISLSINCF